VSYQIMSCRTPQRGLDSTLRIGAQGVSVFIGALMLSHIILPCLAKLSAVKCNLEQTQWDLSFPAW
jgi:hypothetical protein